MINGGWKKFQAVQVSIERDDPHSFPRLTVEFAISPEGLAMLGHMNPGDIYRLAEMGLNADWYPPLDQEPTGWWKPGK